MTMPSNKQLPKVTPMPAPPPQARANRAVHDTYSEEALRVAQRSIDQIQEIDRLGQELEEWRRRAMLAEAEIKRLEKRNDDLEIMLERQRDQLTDERDAYRMKLNGMMAQFHTAGAVILKCIEAGQGAIASPVNLTTLANEIESDQRAQEAQAQAEPRPASSPREGGEPLPGFLAAGPRTDEK